MSGAQLQRLLDERIRHYQGEIRETTLQLGARADRGRASDLDDELEGWIERCERRVELLVFLREHLEPGETYRLGEYDLRFADLLPAEEWEFDCACLTRRSRQAAAGGEGAGSQPPALARETLAGGIASP